MFIVCFLQILLCSCPSKPLLALCCGCVNYLGENKSKVAPLACPCRLGTVKEPAQSGHDVSTHKEKKCQMPPQCCQIRALPLTVVFERGPSDRGTANPQSACVPEERCSPSACLQPHAGQEETGCRGSEPPVAASAGATPPHPCAVTLPSYGLRRLLRKIKLL